MGSSYRPRTLLQLSSTSTFEILKPLRGKLERRKVDKRKTREKKRRDEKKREEKKRRGRRRRGVQRTRVCPACHILSVLVQD